MKGCKLKMRIRELESELREARAGKAAVEAEAFGYRLLLEHYLTLAVAAGAEAREAVEVLQAKPGSRRLRVVPS